MARMLRDAAGLVLVVASLAAMVEGVGELRAHDHLAAILVLGAGLSVLRAGVDLLRPSIGE